MNGYAPNPSSSDDNACAPLTAGLLARKGEALPAVDADAHAGVDLAAPPKPPANGATRKGVSQETIESLYPVVPEKGEARPRSNVHRFLRPGEPANGAPDDAAHQASWTAMSMPNKSYFEHKARPQRPPIQDQPGPKANVTFRMAARDFIRLRFAARDLEMSCQSVILDALDCYLDANDIEQVSDEVCEAETERLMQKLAKRRSG